MLTQAFSKIWLIILIVIIGGFLVWQHFRTEDTEMIETPEIKLTESSKEEEEVVKLTLESLENAEYYFALFEKRARLIDGLHGEEEIFDKDGFPYLFSAGMVKDKVAFGDLNNDEKEDATVIIYSTGGRSGLFYELAVMINENGSPYHLSSKYLGDRIRVNSVSIQDGIITLERIIHDVGDAACCPTLHKVSQYKLFENELLELE
ncbi:hypothetical protein AMJ48_02790 [Parcubacteria bacterium DG_74_1]|nr:MAG: hypothetical protein AMJ48_02790 [Parcubacteria bacterium DG_74_1]